MRNLEEGICRMLTPKQEEFIKEKHRLEEELFTYITSVRDEIMKKDFSKRYSNPILQKAYSMWLKFSSETKNFFMEESSNGLEEEVDKNTSIMYSLMRSFGSLHFSYDDNVNEYQNEICHQDIETDYLKVYSTEANKISDLIDYKEKGTLPEDISLYTQQQLSCELPYLREELSILTEACLKLQVKIYSHESRAAVLNKQNEEMKNTIDKYNPLVFEVCNLLGMQSQSNDTHQNYDAKIKN